MRILLDECRPLDFRHTFPNHDAHTTQWAGLKSKKNGELLLAAEASGYAGRKLTIILVQVVRWRENSHHATEP
jgi:hypothetical protein